MNRREFLLGGAAAAVCGGCATTQPSCDVTLAGMPAMPSGRREVLDVRTYRVEVGATKPFRVLHFSDTHLNFMDVSETLANEAYYRHAYRRWKRFPQAANSFHATLDRIDETHPDLVVHTGDLIDFSTAANLRFLRRNRLSGGSILCAIGNHEYENPDGNYSPDKASCRDRVAAFASNGLTLSSRTVNGVVFVAFDNALHNVSAELSRKILAEFDRGLPVVLCCHIAPWYSEAFRVRKLRKNIEISLFSGGKPEDWEDVPPPPNIWEAFDEATRDFWLQVKERANFKAVLCGHAHLAYDEPFGCGHMYLAGGNYEGCLNEYSFC